MLEDEKDNIEYADDNGLEPTDLIGKIKRLKEKLEQCQKEKQEYLAGWQRSQADFINYRRRQEEQIGEWLKMSGENIIKDILPVLDTLESGIMSQKSGAKNDGLELVKKQLLKILTEKGLEEIKSVGEKFNPEFHEAIEQVESEDGTGIIAEEVQKGYLMNGRVVRPAKVKVIK